MLFAPWHKTHKLETITIYSRINGSNLGAKMGRISNEDMEAKGLELISMWLSQEENWLYYADVKDEAVRVMGFSKSALQRNLQWLVKTGKLETKKEGDQAKSRKTLYRPNQEYYKKTFRWIPIRRDANDSEYLFFIGLADEITETFDKTCQDLVKLSDVPEPLGNIPPRPDLNELNARIAKLIRAARLDLSKEYFNESRDPVVAYAQLRKSIKRMVTSYMDLWAFITLTHGARKIFADQMGSVQRKVSVLKHTL